VAGMARHHAPQQRHGPVDHLRHLGRRSSCKPGLHDRRLEQPRATARPGNPARARGQGPKIRATPIGAPPPLGSLWIFFLAGAVLGGAPLPRA
jgi:hypothetical protein